MYRRKLEALLALALSEDATRLSRKQIEEKAHMSFSCESLAPFKCDEEQFEITVRPYHSIVAVYTDNGEELPTVLQKRINDFGSTAVETIELSSGRKIQLNDILLDKAMVKRYYYNIDANRIKELLNTISEKNKQKLVNKIESKKDKIERLRENIKTLEEEIESLKEDLTNCNY